MHNMSSCCSPFASVMAAEEEEVEVEPGPGPGPADKEMAQSLHTLLNALSRFHRQLNVGDDVLNITIDLRKLQSLPAHLNPGHLSSLLQQHILDLQYVSDKLKLMTRKDLSGSGNRGETMLLTKPDNYSNLAMTGHKQISNKPINLKTKVFLNDAQNKYEGQDEPKSQTDTELVQIKANRDEIERRISAFMERKQAEINENNIREFCNVINCNQENSCARTDAVFTPHPGFKSHIKVSRVVNTYGPQTRTEGVEASLQKCETMTQNCGNPAVEERLHNMETHLKLPTDGPVPIDIYQRIKRLEDRILHLEGLSPEYFQHVNFPSKRRKVHETIQGYSLIEIDEKINELKAVLLQKANDQTLPTEADKMPMK
ncbi:MAP3K12-binding inhibitory protein 1 isoform X3 [Chiloscyllium plagiosum]|uniref:MAP3K12-binding inhibitory protein 1 isoform X3 n=1 Tax=Chiloscyllium plagiosum TaxID=36176 RepID=UPI001CB7D225|nr:MAP3K12-binding inhibitory protein 1 isoform X3 [Chiloscyllium plagiosum]